MRPLAIVLLGVLLLPGAAWATCTETTPTLCLSLNQSTFQAGQALQLSATVTPGGTPPPFDVYVALFIPPSTLLFLQGNGAFTTNMTPLAAGWTPSAVSGQLFGYAFGGFGGNDSDSRLPVGYLSQDDNWITDELHDLLENSEVIRLEDNVFLSAADFEKLVVDGDLAAVVIVPDGYGTALLRDRFDLVHERLRTRGPGLEPLLGQMAGFDRERRARFRGSRT